MLKKMTEIGPEGNRWRVWNRGYPEVGTRHYDVTLVMPCGRAYALHSARQ